MYDDEGCRGELSFDHTESAAGTTQVRLHGQVETGTSLFDRALRPVVGRYLTRQFRNSLRTMTELIEAEDAADGQDPVEA